MQGPSYLMSHIYELSFYKTVYSKDTGAFWSRRASILSQRCLKLLCKMLFILIYSYSFYNFSKFFLHNFPVSSMLAHDTRYLFKKPF